MLAAGLAGFASAAHIARGAGSAAAVFAQALRLARALLALLLTEVGKQQCAAVLYALVAQLSIHSAESAVLTSRFFSHMPPARGPNSSTHSSPMAPYLYCSSRRLSVYVQALNWVGLDRTSI